jgi:hypothetical protein
LVDCEGTRSFCPQCGTQTFEHADFLEEIDVTTCSLDNPEALPPTDHTYTSSKLGWVQLADDPPVSEEPARRMIPPGRNIHIALGYTRM